MAEFFRINADNPQERLLNEVVKILKKGGLVIYPTDTVYGVGCDLNNTAALKKLLRFKGLKANKMNLSFICYDLSDITTYVKHIETPTFRILKKALPGPYTFIMNASSAVPKLVDTKKKEVGIRVPDNNIPRELVRLLGNPIVTTSLKQDDDILEYPTDPELIYEDYEKQVDAVIDGGFGNIHLSTVVNLTNGDFDVVREGAGDISDFL
ncbi:threonylcarbamoyl-AMP synthase [Flammeovirga yaeyamensis]|uniref:Threonylcarbamoyl-AMP synthase n=1 Tax=Flammeovirga yaeyamensis TaxID=367791 RepID=A0AAX1N3H5_9BACT|nr:MULTISPECIES: L-threonylcarbamoyladenylate synthase [Flammeovirga]ANQ50738.1 threonylcarbamoyl-AMP synthase [Flammeovirga sp. MY04]MBB3701076.1 tRNA threonylcarbamoyl adenosine modification protein (Sua5/YciO/YrdC/YwlC family) [Flammeovirga yaeyamensis]NMF38094.1 threonylcarbamoyl-AMP synthase [Flammeovirga yaeyamensis]QWG01866.1 threonylcarbamoyl-AMP synthase [Flammeovirga yaeyamensis]